MVTRRSFRRLLPIVCAVILLRIYVIRLQDDAGVAGEDAEIHKWHEFTSNEDNSEPKHPNALERVNGNILDSQDDEFLLGRGNEKNASEETIKTGGGSSEVTKAFGNTLDSIPLWTRITDDIYTYSGFWDSRLQSDGPAARVLGIMRYKKEVMQPGNGFKLSPWVKENMLNCSCLLWYSGKSSPSPGVLTAFVYEEGIKEFTGTFFLCHPVSQSKSDNSLGPGSADTFGDDWKDNIPYAVSFVPDDNNGTSFNVVYLKNTGTPGQDGSSAVCVRPLFGPFDDLLGIAQFIAYYTTVLKTNTFYLYELAIAENVREYLSKLSASGVDINILPWNIPTTDWERLWDLGSLTALNDCVYRASGQQAYVAVVDIDEFIVPKISASNLEEVYQRVLAQKKGKHGDAAIIRNVFFCHEFEGSEAESSTDLPIFKYTHRESRTWPAKQRSKMIVAPETVMSLGHHMIHHFTEEGLKNQGAPNTIAVMHHYRNCEGVNLGIHSSGERVLDQEITKDGSMRKLKTSLMKSSPLQIYRQLISSKV